MKERSKGIAEKNEPESCVIFCFGNGKTVKTKVTMLV